MSSFNVSDMSIGHGRVVFLVVLVIAVCRCQARKLYDDTQNDEDDSWDCNDGGMISDPILVAYLQKIRGQEMIPSGMKEWIIYFDGNKRDAGELFGDTWARRYLTEFGVKKDSKGVPYGQVFFTQRTNVYVPRLSPISDGPAEFKVMYAEQLLLDAVEKVKIFVAYEPHSQSLQTLSESSARLLQKLLMLDHPAHTVTVVSSSCDSPCIQDRWNPLIGLASCGIAYGKEFRLECRHPREVIEENFFNGSRAFNFDECTSPQIKVDLPIKLRRELQGILDWLLKRIGQRMHNHMEMAFTKNRFRKTPMDLYSKVHLQISKIRGGITFEAARSSDLIYNSLFDLNVYLNVTNTPYTFDKFLIFNQFLSFIGRFSRWRLDTTKYANFFEPLKEECLSFMSHGYMYLRPATKIFELEDGVYDLNGAICHENVLYIVSEMATMNTIKSGIYDNGDCDFYTVFVLGKKNLTINENLILSGKNLVIFSPTWIIGKQQTIDLSGKNGNFARAGKVESGESGGDFFGFGMKFEKPELLTIVSNGGNGSRGRDSAEVVSDFRFLKLEEDECTVESDRLSEIVAEYGGTPGGPGGSPGSVTLKVTRSSVQSVTVIGESGKAGVKGKITDIVLVCPDGSKVTVPADMAEVHIPPKHAHRMSESAVLGLFRKIVRRNSMRLSYDVLSFYKEIWVSPIMGQTLDSTLSDFLNVTDFINDSKEFYEITSQILHSQMHHVCNMSDAQAILLDFALATIRMKTPVEGALRSVIDLEGYLQIVSRSIKKRIIEDEYVEKKEEKFIRIVEKANLFLLESLLPSLKQTITETNHFLNENMDRLLSHRDADKAEQFVKHLTANSLVRYLIGIFSHVQTSLQDFVAKGGPQSSSQEDDSSTLEKNLYFFRNTGNNMTANDMNALRKFIEILKRGVENEGSKVYENKCEEDAAVIDTALLKVQQALETTSLTDYACQQCKAIVEDAKNAVMASTEEAEGSSDQRSRRKRLASPSSQCKGCSEHKRNTAFDEIEYGLIYSTNGIQYHRNSPDDSGDPCKSCSDCRRCPGCPRCRMALARMCRTCSCTECPFCWKCSQNRVKQFFEVSQGSKLGTKGTNSNLQVRNCPQCKDRNIVDENDEPKTGSSIPADYKQLQPLPQSMQQVSRLRTVNSENDENGLLRKLEECCQSFLDLLREVWKAKKGDMSPSEGYLLPRSEEWREREGTFDSKTTFPTSTLPSEDCGSDCGESASVMPSRSETSSEETLCRGCLKSIEDLRRSLQNYLVERGGSCSDEVQNMLSTVKGSIRDLQYALKIPAIDAISSVAPIHFKCSGCSGTLDFFTDRLSAEVTRCEKENNYDYRETDSYCSGEQEIIFHVTGCDPETFSRTYDEIHGDFLKEFSQFVTADKEHSDELDGVPLNIGYLLTSVDMLLQEGNTLSNATLGNVLFLTDYLVKFKDLKTEYKKRVIELHDFCETDIYDLFSARLSMQNEHLDMMSKWLNQLKKLTSWMWKVTQYLRTDTKFLNVNEKILQAMRLLSEIGHNVRVVERHRELKNYIHRVRRLENRKILSEDHRTIIDFKPVLRDTIFSDVFSKAMTAAANWMFPLTESYLSLKRLLQERRSEPYESKFAMVAEEIEKHRKFMLLHTAVQSFDSNTNDVPFYVWNVKTRPSLLKELFSGKPVVLVSEILDGGKRNSLMAKEFEIKFVADENGQNDGVQEEIDSALKGFWLNVTHSGISYFKFGSRIYRRLTETFTFRHTAGGVDREKMSPTVDYVLSPYTTWILRMEPVAGGEFPRHIVDKIGVIELIGSGQYIVNCADIPDVNQHFTPLKDYRRRDEKLER